MKPKNLFNLFAILVLALAMASSTLAVSQTQAQEPEPQGSNAAQGTILGTTFTYQGRLTDTSGNPIAGPCNLRFTLYQSAAGADQVGTPQTKSGVTLDNGYFSVELDFGADAFTGEARYMKIEVDCGSGYTALSPRVKLTAAPYAHSLRPGATVEGSTSDYVLFVDNNGTGDGLRAHSSATQYDFAALYGFNSSTGSGVYGVNTGGGYGVYGKVHAGGYGVYSEGNAHVEGNLTWKAKTSYIAVSAAAFHPTDDGYDFSNGGYDLWNDDSNSDYFNAPVQLPHGATVTKLTFYWWDGSANDGNCRLYRPDLAGGEVEMAEALTSGSAATSSSSFDDTIAYATVDNSQYAYYLYVYLPNSLVAAYGAVIEYTINEPY